MGDQETMSSRRFSLSTVIRLANIAIPGFLMSVLCSPLQPQSGDVSNDLYGTEWSLIRFESRDGIVLVPGDSSAYTVSFAADQSVSVRVDCNRGQGTWSSKERGQIEFTPLVLTWAECSGSPINTHLPKDYQAIRSYAIKDGHLFLFLKANGGNYEFVPQRSKSGQEKEVKGTISYRERLALPPDAVLEAALQDVSKADAPAVIVAQITVKQLGSPPIPFVISYNPSVIDAGHRYAIRARILASEQLLFTTDETQPVLTGSVPDEVSLLLGRAGPESSTDQSSQPVVLEDTHWTLVRLENKDLPPTDHRRVPYLLFNAKDHRLSGFNGCNRLVGSYELDGEKLSLSPIATTRMACIAGMDIEQHFTEILQRVSRWKLNERSLELFDSGGNRLARFEASLEKHPDDR